MKTKKMSLAILNGKLTRAEMKKIMAGSGTGCNRFQNCIHNPDCNIPWSNGCQCDTTYTQRCY